MIIMEEKRSARMCAGIIPDYAHRLIKFLTASLYIQDTIYKKASKNYTEQWVELVVRFYIYDACFNAKRSTFDLLKKLKCKVFEMIKCAFQFERLLRSTKPTDKIRAAEKRMEQDWNTLYEQMAKQVKRKSRLQTGKQTKKKSFA